MSPSLKARARFETVFSDTMTSMNERAQEAFSGITLTIPPELAQQYSLETAALKSLLARVNGEKITQILSEMPRQMGITTPKKDQLAFSCVAIPPSAAGGGMLAGYEVNSNTGKINILNPILQNVLRFNPAVFEQRKQLQAVKHPRPDQKAELDFISTFIDERLLDFYTCVHALVHEHAHQANIFEQQITELRDLPETIPDIITSQRVVQEKIGYGRRARIQSETRAGQTTEILFLEWEFLHEGMNELRTWLALDDYLRTQKISWRGLTLSDENLSPLRVRLKSQPEGYGPALQAIFTIARAIAKSTGADVEYVVRSFNRGNVSDRDRNHFLWTIVGYLGKDIMHKLKNTQPATNEMVQLEQEIQRKLAKHTGDKFFIVHPQPQNHVVHLSPSPKS